MVTVEVQRVGLSTYLVVSKSDLDFKLVGHDEFVGFK